MIIVFTITVPSLNVETAELLFLDELLVEDSAGFGDASVEGLAAY